MRPDSTRHQMRLGPVTSGRSTAAEFGGVWLPCLSPQRRIKPFDCYCYYLYGVHLRHIHLPAYIPRRLSCLGTSFGFFHLQQLHAHALRSPRL